MINPRFSIAVLVGLSWPVIVTTCVGFDERAEPSEFRQKLMELQFTRPQEIGREQLVRRCEDLTREFHKGNEVAEIALFVAGLYELQDPKHDIAPDRIKALNWYAVAANSGVPGSSIWCDARIKYAHRLCQERSSDGISRARDILLATQPMCVSTIHRMRAVQGLYSLSLQEGKLVDAEKYCRSMLRGDFIDKNCDLTNEEKARIEAIKFGAAGSLIQRWGLEEIDPVENEKRILQFREDCADIPGLQKSVEIALASIRRMPPHIPPSGTPLTTGKPWRYVLIIVNVAGILIVVFTAINRHHKRIPEQPLDATLASPEIRRNELAKPTGPSPDTHPESLTLEQ